MQIVRAKYENDIFYGELHENKVTRYDGSPFVIWENTEEVYDLDEIELLAPVLPSKVVAIARTMQNMQQKWDCLNTVVAFQNTQ